MITLREGMMREQDVACVQEGKSERFCINLANRGASTPHISKLVLPSARDSPSGMSKQGNYSHSASLTLSMTTSHTSASYLLL